MTTSKTSGTYQGPANGSLGEPMPIGLARALYEACSETCFEGELVLEQNECVGTVAVGHVVNIVNSKRPEWATARMMVFETSEEVYSGRTVVTVGPEEKLTVADIVDWLRGLRSANQGIWASRATGLNHSGGALRMAARAHKQSLSSGKEGRERLVLMRPDAVPAPTGENSDVTTQARKTQIALDIMDALGLEIKLREWTVCVHGVEKYATFLSSEISNTPMSSNPLP